MEGLIQQIFVNEIQFKRVSKELVCIKQQLDGAIFRISYEKAGQGLRIVLDLEPTTLKLLHLNKGKTITLHIILENKFPFSFPRVFFKSFLMNPLFSDGRDFIEDILQRPWTPSILVHQIIALVPKFLARVELARSDRQSLLTLGRYHVDTDYSIVDLKHLNGMSVFTCRDKKQQQFMVVNSTYVLFFDVVSNNSTILFNFEPLTNLISVLKKESSSNEIILVWQDEHQKDGRPQTIWVYESEECLNTLIHIKQTGGSLIKRHYSIPEEEVTLKQYQSTHIEDIIMSIQIMESQLSVNITLNLVESIMNHYQKAIEYFSAHNDQSFEDFVDRLHQLLSREDVQLILRSTECMPPQFIYVQVQPSPKKNESANTSDSEGNSPFFISNVKREVQQSIFDKFDEQQQTNLLQEQASNSSSSVTGEYTQLIETSPVKLDSKVQEIVDEQQPVDVEKESHPSHSITKVEQEQPLEEESLVEQPLVEESLVQEQVQQPVEVEENKEQSTQESKSEDVQSLESDTKIELKEEAVAEQQEETVVIQADDDVVVVQKDTKSKKKGGKKGKAT